MVKIILSSFLSLLCLVPVALAKSTGSSCSVEDGQKVDCGYVGTSQSSCESSGCCWSPAGENSQTPWCYKATGSSTPSNYALSSPLKETAYGLEGVLTLKSSGGANYGADITSLKIEVLFEDANYLRVKITDANKPRWEVPLSVVERPQAVPKAASTDYEFTYTESPFSFQVSRKSDSRVLFKSSSDLVYKDQYIQLSTEIESSAKTFGLGESARLTHALPTGATYTLWAADIAALSKDSNLYGSFPYYLQMVSGAAHGVMLLNSNGMDVSIQNDNKMITFKTIGGVIDLYVFNGPTPNAVVSQYTSVVGRPMMMPYWSLGFHNCKYGYESVYQVEEVVANYSSAGIPLDTQWMDIDYMQNYRDFTTDSEKFPQSEVKSFVDTLHKNGQHFVPIVDPGIMVMSGYDAYEEGLKLDLFIKDVKGGNYLGQVWPGPTYFPDFFHPSAQQYWTDQLSSFYDAVPVDGIWIDMNEVSNFCNVDGKGQVCTNTANGGCPSPGASQTTCCLVCSQVDSTNSLDFPPYSIGNDYGLLSTKTISMSASHYGNVSVYNAHNLYGITEQIATNAALTQIRKQRPFVLTRSSFIGTGRYSAKWTGDNGATWDDLKSSVISIMDFNIFGVPMIGADICGFIYDTTEELCARWIEVGAFYPFVRNHNALGSKPQELYLWESVTQAAKKALGMRYKMLPYLYTLFYGANSAGEMVTKPLWATFPDDNTALSVQNQFMVGPAVLISPVLEQGATSINAYFPAGLWYNFADYSISIDSTAGGVFKSLSTPLTEINVHVLGGNVLPLQNSAMTTTAARTTPFTLLVALCKGGKATGSLYWDDGEQISLDHFLTASYSAETSSPTSGVFTGAVTFSDSTAKSMFSTLKVDTIIIMGKEGALSTPSSASMNGKSLDSNQITMDSDKVSITFSSLSVSLTEAISLLWN